MCMEPISTGLALASAGTKLVGGIMGGRAEAKAGRTNAQMLADAANAREAKAAFDSDNRLKKAAFDIETSKRESSRKIGTVRANIGGSGFDAQSFSEVLADDAAEAALEVAAIKYTGDLDAYEMRYAGNIDARQLRNQSASQRSSARDAEIGGWISGIGGAASSLGSIFSKPTGAATEGWGATVSLK